MAEQITQASNIVAGKAIDVLAAAYAAGRKVRFWCGSGGDITGVWKTRDGRTAAASTATAHWPAFPESRDTCRVYFGMDLAGSWDNPCAVATKEAMEAYRTEWLADR